MSPFQVVSAAFTISFLGGLFALLRSGQPITFRLVIAIPSYAGVMGIIIALLWMDENGKVANPFQVLAIAGVTGLGGLSVFDLMMLAMKKSGITLQFNRPKDEGGTP